MYILIKRLWVHQDAYDAFMKHADFNSAGSVGLQSFTGYAQKGIVAQAVDAEGNPVRDAEGWIGFLAYYEIESMTHWQNYTKHEVRKRKERTQFIERYKDKMRATPHEFYEVKIVKERKRPIQAL